jgi:tetratricopeptide repeat protein
MGELDEARQLFKKAVELSRRTLGPENPQSANLTRKLEVVVEALRTSQGT